MTLETLHKWESGAKIFALIAVPIIAGITPAIIQSRSSTQSLQKDYVTLAIGILARKKGEQADNNLRKWAVDIIDKNSPVPLTPQLKEQLGVGDFSLTTWSYGRPIDWEEIIKRDDEARAKLKQSLEDAQKREAANPPGKQ